MALREFLIDIIAPLLRLGGAGGPMVTPGTGSPEGVLTAPVGSLYLRTDGGTGTTHYRKEAGVGDTGWVAAAAGGGGGSGDVVGPASATDKAVVRFNTTTGKLIANSPLAVSDLGEIDMPTVASPATPAAGRGRLFLGDSASRVMPRFIGPSGQDATLQPHIGKNKISKWVAAGNSAVIVADGAGPLTAGGTATTRNWSTTNRSTRLRMVEWLVTTAAATAVAFFRGGAATWTVGDISQPDMGGFHFVCIWGTATGCTVATHRGYVGMTAAVATPTDVDPSTIANIVGMGWDAADANIQIMHRGVGAITKIDLGASFLVPTIDRANSYMLELFSPTGTTTKVGYKVTNIENGAVASGVITTNLPLASVAMAPRGWMSVGGTSSVIGIALSSLYIETDW